LNGRLGGLASLSRTGTQPWEEWVVTVLSEEVVSAARLGDADALGLVYRDLAPKVLGYLRARGVEDPESLTNEVFLNVIPRLANLTGGVSGLQTLVFSVAHARVVDEVRRRARRPAQVPWEPELAHRFEGAAESAMLSWVATRDVMDILNSLGEEQKVVVVLRVLADLSLEQTAEVVGKSVGAVKQLQRRGLLALRGLIERGEVAW